MYVCICQQITCGQIRAAADQGINDIRELKQQLGVASQCGKCARCARGVLEQALGAKAPDPPSPQAA
jgi:bacterioferritin-associated ferredoxin